MQTGRAKNPLLPRLCVSALSGGGGKTLLALGLARAFTGRGLVVRPFKKGPDYIDAAWLELAAGQPVSNLDPFFLPPWRLRALFVHAMRAADEDCLGLVEGNRGLYDGLDSAGSCSTAALARALDCPVLLSVNCSKMTRTAAALVRGITAFEPGLDFCGVVFNRTGSARHASALRRAIEEYTDLPVLGALPRLSENPLPERHMGIASWGPVLSDAAETVLERLAAFVRENVDADAVLAAARSAPPMEKTAPFWPEEDSEICVNSPHITTSGALQPLLRIGYVRDSALWFYYRENLEALAREGAELTRLSLLDEAPWPEIDGLYLGGGFPEDCAKALSASAHVALLRRLADRGLPIYAECGGFMLLSRGIRRGDEFWPMSGVFPVTTRFCDKPQGLGYVEGAVVAENPYFPVGLGLRGHEFHYSRCEWEGETPVCALKLTRGKGMREGMDALAHNNVWAAYTHIFAPAAPCWARNFVKAARRFRMEQNSA
ncbi:MAG: cobyrinate a,c-diamide synthase [Desulfovibrio sp.]|jgi:cobyrinic acid a,c-diamide synthase|nr:cobyrinate a,c-diamide synthase [Desulfovibrio sp.]